MRTALLLLVISLSRPAWAIPNFDAFLKCPHSLSDPDKHNYAILDDNDLDSERKYWFVTICRPDGADESCVDLVRGARDQPVVVRWQDSATFIIYEKRKRAGFMSGLTDKTGKPIVVKTEPLERLDAMRAPGKSGYEIPGILYFDTRALCHASSPIVSMRPRKVIYLD